MLVADERFDTVAGAILAAPGGGWSFRLDAAAGFTDTEPDDTTLLVDLADGPSHRQAGTLSYRDHLARLTLLENTLRSNPWLTTFVGDTAVEAVVATVLGMLTPADLGVYGQIVLSALPRRAVTSPLIRLPDDEL